MAHPYYTQPRHSRIMRACENCGRDFEAVRSWQQFCTTQCRHRYFGGTDGTQSWQNTDGTLSWCGPGLTPCYYCGVPADSTDHVVPKAFLAHGELVAEAVRQHRILTVPCCRECNSILGARYHQTLADRKKAAKDGIRKKYRPIIASPEWTEGELTELGESLGRYISTCQQWREWVRSRLTW